MWWNPPERTTTEISDDSLRLLASDVFGHNNDTAIPKPNPNPYPYNMLNGKMTDQQYYAMVLSLQHHQSISIDDFSSQLDDGTRRLIHVSEFPPHEFEKNQTCSPIMTEVSAYSLKYPAGQKGKLQYFVPQDESKEIRIGKPGGLWYTFGLGWLKLICAHGDSVHPHPELYLKKKPYIYEIKLKSGGPYLYTVSNEEEYLQVMEKHAFPQRREFPYRDEPARQLHLNMLDWTFYVRNFCGFSLEIDPHNLPNNPVFDGHPYTEFSKPENMLRFFDIPSGVIWDTRCISEYKYLGQVALIGDGEEYEEFGCNDIQIFKNKYPLWKSYGDGTSYLDSNFSNLPCYQKHLSAVNAPQRVYQSDQRYYA